MLIENNKLGFIHAGGQIRAIITFKEHACEDCMVA